MLISEANPNLRVHEQAVMHVDYALLDAVGAQVDRTAFFTFTPLQAMQPKQEAILGLYNMFFGFVSPQTAKLDKVASVANSGCNVYSSVSRRR